MARWAADLPKTSDVERATREHSAGGRLSGAKRRSPARQPARLGTALRAGPRESDRVDWDDVPPEGCEREANHLEVGTASSKPMNRDGQKDARHKVLKRQPPSGAGRTES